MQEGDSSQKLVNAHQIAQCPIVEKTIPIITAAVGTSSLGEQNYFESDGSVMQKWNFRSDSRTICYSGPRLSPTVKKNTGVVTGAREREREREQFMRTKSCFWRAHANPHRG
jgi:hypothetical protein